MKKMKEHGLLLFNYQLDKLEHLFNNASRQKNPALWLYQNDARTCLFMLEALGRLYAGITQKKLFIKLEVKFKLLEDVLGAIDYYDVFAKEFAKNKKIPTSITQYIQAQAREKTQQLNEILFEKKWITESTTGIQSIKKKLDDINWIKEKKEIGLIHQFYVQTIEHILAFVNKEDFHFENIESDVHELRRKLRWLSIYPHALRGSIQLSKIKKYPKNISKYLTKEVINSPFNKMPEAGNDRYFLLLDKNYFLALSWLIAELGRLKDSGLRVIVIKEALQQTASLTDDASLKKAYAITGKTQPTIPELLKKSDAVCKTYFKEKNLERLIIGTRKIK
jgi:hypothetical protein